MDFLDPKKKRKHRQLLFIGYGLMAIALGIVTALLFLRSGGYNVDPITGEIVKNGLVFIDAHPEPARVHLNGEDKGTTDLRLDIPAGNYELELSRDGYRTWKRSFSLEGSTVERFVYPFLFPTDLEITEAQLYASPPPLVTESPDRRWLVAQQPGSFTQFDVTDLNSDALTSRVVALPAGLLETRGTSHTLELVEWSTDNINVLLKHNFEGGHEFLVLNTESPGSSRNLNRTFQVPFTAVSLRDKKFDLFYLYNQADKTLQAADARNGQVTPVLNEVITFKPHGTDVLVYVTAAGAAEGNVLLRVREGLEDFTVREMPGGGNFYVDVARFNGAWYFVVASTAEKKAFIYKNPVSAIKRLINIRPVPAGALRLDTAPEAVSFSGNARFIAVQGGSQFSVYDAETDRQYRYETGLKLVAGQKALWMDGHRLTIVADGKTVVFDYDGTNLQQLGPAVTGTPVLFDRDYEALYSVAPSTQAPSRFAITRTELRVE